MASNVCRSETSCSNSIIILSFTWSPPIMRSRKNGRIAKRSTKFIGPIKNWNFLGEQANRIWKEIWNRFHCLTNLLFLFPILHIWFSNSFYSITVYSIRKKTTAILSIISIANWTVGYFSICTPFLSNAGSSPWFSGWNSGNVPKTKVIVETKTTPNEVKAIT